MPLIDKNGNRFRRARVNSVAFKGILEVRALLPENYRAFYNYDGTIFIEGWDRPQCTLDEHVIPRLAAGFFVAQEEEV